MKVVFVEKPHSLEIREVPVPGPGTGRSSGSVPAASAARTCISTTAPTLWRNIRGSSDTSSPERLLRVGKGVTGFVPGDRVAVDPVTSCGTCYPCSIGRPNVCERLEVFGVHRDGGFAEYIVLPEKNLHRIPSDWSFEGSPRRAFTIAANVLSRTECAGSDRLLIAGAGPIGRSDPAGCPKARNGLRRGRHRWCAA